MKLGLAGRLRTSIVLTHDQQQSAELKKMKTSKEAQGALLKRQITNIQKSTRIEEAVDTAVKMGGQSLP